MKIAMIGSRGVDSDYSGVETSLREICPRLVERGHDVHVFSEDKKDGLSTYRGVKIVRVRALYGKHSETLSRSAIATFKSIGRGFDVLNFHAQGSGIFCPIARLFQNRSVVTVHGLDWQRDKWSSFAQLSLKTAERVAVYSADQLVVVGKGLLDYFKQTYDRNAVFIPNGITPRTRPAEAQQQLSTLGLSPRDYVLFASRLVPEKGCHELIQAYNAIDTHRKLVIAGGSRYQDEYIGELKRLADPAKVIFTGHVSGDLLAALFSNAYLFVLPSHIEGLSNALLEALAYQTCPLISDIPENRAVAEDLGYSFKVGDVTDLRARLTDLLENEEKVRAAESHLNGVVQDTYNWDNIVRRYEEVYTALQ